MLEIATGKMIAFSDVCPEDKCGTRGNDYQTLSM